MGIALLKRLLGRGDTDEAAQRSDESDTDADERDTEESGFLRSRLDASVLYAHGAQTERIEADTEVSEEEADALDAYHDEQ